MTTPDFTLLPVAARQRPDWTTYLALNPRSQAHGWSYTDPVTGVRVRKITDATYPAANTQAFHDYANGGPYVSRVWTGGDGKERVTLHVQISGGTGYLIDAILGASGGVENSRLDPAQPSNTASSWSTKSATPRVWFAMAGTVLRCYDTSTGSEITNSAFPKDFAANLHGGVTWLTHSQDETWFTLVDNGVNPTFDPQFILYNTLTGVVKVFTTADVTAGDSINEGYMSPSGRYAVISLNSSSGNFIVYDTVTGHKSARYTSAVESFSFSHYSILSNGTSEWIASSNLQGSLITMANLPLVPITADGQVLTGAVDRIQYQTSEHTASEYCDGNTGGYQLAHSTPDEPVTLASPTLDSGAVYTFAISAGYPLWLANVGVNDVVTVSAAGHVTASLTKAASRGAMTAGSFFHTLGSSTLYVWMPDGSAPTASTVKAFSMPLAPQCAFVWNMTGTDLRLLYHHYSGTLIDATYEYFKLPFVTWGVDGRVSPFVTTSGVLTGASDVRGDVYLAEIPTTGGTGGVAGPAWLLARFNRDQRH